MLGPLGIPSSLCLRSLPNSLSSLRFLCSSRPPTSLLPDSHREVPSSVHSVSLFFKRAEDTRKLLNLLDEKPWVTSEAFTKTNKKPWKALNVKLSSFVVSEVIRICTDLDTGLELFTWWKEESESRLKLESGLNSVSESKSESELESESLSEPESESDRIWVYVSVMNRLGKARRLEEMEAVAIECETEGIVSVETFTVQLCAYRDMEILDGVVKTWKRMEKFGVKPNLISYTTLLDMFAMAEMYDVAADVYLLFLWEGFFPNVKTLTVLINHMSYRGKLEAAMDVFSDLAKVKVKPNELTFCALMRGYAKAEQMNKVLDLVRLFKDLGNRPNTGVFQGLFQFFLRENKTDNGDKVLLELWPESTAEDRKAMMAKYAGLVTPGSITTPVMEGSYSCSRLVGDGIYTGSGAQGSYTVSITDGNYTDEEVEDTGRCLSMSLNPAEMWNYIGLVRCINAWTPAVAATLERANVKWDGHLVSELMKRIRSPEVGWKFFIWVEGQAGFSHDKYTYTRMIQLLLSEPNFLRAQQLVVEAQSKRLDLSLHTYNNILKFCGLKRATNVALDVFELVKRAGLKPDVESYKHLLYALHGGGRYWRVATVCSEMEKMGFTLDASIYSFLVCGFAEAGKVKYAKAFYKRMRTQGLEPSEHFYEAFIVGFFRTGRLHKAEEMFGQMKRDGLVPSSQLYDLMIEVFRKRRNHKALREVKCEKKLMELTKPNKKRKVLDSYFKFYQVFRGSFEEDNDDERNVGQIREEQRCV